MKRFLVLVAFSSLFSLPLTAQDPKLILFGGFQYLRDGNADGFGDRINASGWNASAAFQFNKHFGVAADFSGSYRSTNLINASLGSGGQFPVVFRAYTYSFGPVFTWNAGGKIRPFAHALLGGAHLRPNGCAIFSGSPDECGSGSYGGFTMMLGGGVDALGSKHMGWRLFQLDWVYLPTTDGPGGQSGNVRVSTGPVFHF